MNEIKIDKNVPLPGPRNVIGPILGKMEVGDSVLFHHHNHDSLRGSVTNYGRFNGMKFTTRKDGGGCRVWRTA